jgi:hypothetical protein
MQKTSTQTKENLTMSNYDLNSYQMYMANDCQLGFYVRRNSWHPSKSANVVAIVWVTEGKPIKGNPPYFGGFKNPPGHPREGKTMGPRSDTLEADWLDGGRLMTDSGGNFSWECVKKI